jgi:Vitamin B12 dependent methionine synthase, activation domain
MILLLKISNVIYRLVEAFAEALHADIRRTLWGFAPDEKVPQSLETVTLKSVDKRLFSLVMLSMQGQRINMYSWHFTSELYLCDKRCL